MQIPTLRGQAHASGSLISAGHIHVAAAFLLQGVGAKDSATLL